MKVWHKIITAAIVIITISTGLATIGCGGDSDDEQESAQTQIVPVTRGDLSTTISAIGTVTMSNQADLTFGSGGSTSTVYTVTEVNVKEGDTVTEGDVLAKLDTTSLQNAVTQAKATLRTAQINLEQASSEANLLKAQAAVESAEISLTNAESELTEAQGSALTDAQTGLETAQTNLEIAQTTAASNIKDAENAADDAYDTWNDFIWTNWANLTNPDIIKQRVDLEWALEKAQNNIVSVTAQSETTVANAEAAVETAQKALDDIPLTLKQKQLAVTQAQVNLMEAQDDLSYAEAGYNIEQLQLQVDNAQADLDEAEALLASASLVAPFDGVISSVNAIVGDEVTANTTVIHLVDVDTMEVDASVDEIDVAQVETGQTATITLDALSNVILRGTVTAVSPLASSQSGVVSYPLTIALIDAAGKGLRDGMSATIVIESIQAKDAILVPAKAITRSGRDQVVNVVTDESTGATEQRVVQTGETNSTMTQITSGLEAGEKVTVDLSSTSSSSTTGGMTVQFPGGGSFQVQPGGDGGFRVFRGQ